MIIQSVGYYVHKRLPGNIGDVFKVTIKENGETDFVSQPESRFTSIAPSPETSFENYAYVVTVTSKTFPSASTHGQAPKLLFFARIGYHDERGGEKVLVKIWDPNVERVNEPVKKGFSYLLYKVGIKNGGQDAQGLPRPLEFTIKNIETNLFDVFPAPTTFAAASAQQPELLFNLPTD